MVGGRSVVGGRGSGRPESPRRGIEYPSGAQVWNLTGSSFGTFRVKDHGQGLGML